MAALFHKETAVLAVIAHGGAVRHREREPLIMAVFHRYWSDVGLPQGPQSVMVSLRLFYICVGLFRGYQYDSHATNWR